MNNSCSPLQLAEALTERWSPKVIAQLDDYYIKVAHLKDNLVWHKHELQDELFMVLQGQLTMEYESKKVLINQGELHVVPSNTLHNPVSKEGCLVMVIEHKETTHTGNVTVEKSRPIDEQLNQFQTR
ncbi:MAG: cupin domain-containing protein [Desulfofustis sp.]|nr:cupin domain-containing protein [Desulfofustis sp.]